MAYRRQSRPRTRSYGRPAARSYSRRPAVGRRAPSRARGRSGNGSRQQTVKIVLQTVAAPAISSPFGQVVEDKPTRAKF